MEKTQNKYEQEALIQYCVNREIIRPKTNILTAIKYLVVLEAITLLISFGAAKLLVFVGFDYSFAFLHFFFGLVLILMFIKRFSILLVELYQHFLLFSSEA